MEEEGEPPSSKSPLPPSPIKAKQSLANIACVANTVFSRKPASAIHKFFTPFLNLFNFSKDSQQQRLNKLLQEREEELNPIGGDEHKGKVCRLFIGANVFAGLINSFFQIRFKLPF